MPETPEAPRFTRNLEQKEIFETMPVTLECRVTGYPVPEITWYQVGHMTFVGHMIKMACL